MKLTLDQKLKFEFTRLDIKGVNIESFYNYCFEQFLFDTSELSKAQKIEAIITGQLDGKSEIIIQKVLAERTFIQDQLIRHEANLKEPIHPDNREKVNLWVDYLKQKEKAIIEIQPNVHKWDQPLVALYCFYSGIKITEKEREKIADTFKIPNSPELVKKYNLYSLKWNRYYSNFEEKQRGKAEAQLTRLLNLKLIIEDRNEKESEAYERLLSDIETLKEILGHE